MLKLNRKVKENRDSLKNFGIGVDIESIDRFRNLNQIDHDLFLKRIFTKNELDYCFSKKSHAQHLAARYAAKEAIIKALTSIGKLNLNYKDLEIFNNGSNVPLVRFNAKIYQNLQARLSLSHCNYKAIAFAVITGDNKTEYDEYGKR